MTTIDHQRAAIDAAMPVMRRRDRCPNDSDCLACKAGVGQILTAATPHLRAGIAEEVRDLRSQFHDDAKTAFGRIGSSTEAYLNALDDVLALLEGGDNQ